MWTHFLKDAFICFGGLGLFLLWCDHLHCFMTSLFPIAELFYSFLACWLLELLGFPVSGLPGFLEVILDSVGFWFLGFLSSPVPRVPRVPQH